MGWKMSKGSSINIIGDSWVYEEGIFTEEDFERKLYYFADAWVKSFDSLDIKEGERAMLLKEDLIRHNQLLMKRSEKLEVLYNTKQGDLS
jgi:hypothetical protein